MIAYLQRPILRKEKKGVNTTHAETRATSKNAKYRGLNSTVIASFQPKTTKTPYIQYGI
jgi:hypothetical protein